jgi:hypothetical protein
MSHQYLNNFKHSYLIYNFTAEVGIRRAALSSAEQSSFHGYHTALTGCLRGERHTFYCRHSIKLNTGVYPYWINPIINFVWCYPGQRVAFIAALRNKRGQCGNKEDEVSINCYYIINLYLYMINLTITSKTVCTPAYGIGSSYRDAIIKAHEGHDYFAIEFDPIIHIEM